MMKQSGYHLSLLLLSAVHVLLPDHPPADSPRAPKFLLPASGLAIGAPAELTDIKDIYDPIVLPGQPPYLLFGALLLVLFFIGCALFQLLRNRRSARPFCPVPADRALAQLQQAEELLPQTGTRHYSETVSAILRNYLEQRFDIRVTRQTTTEFLRYLQSLSPATTTTTTALSPLISHTDTLLYSLQLCDLVKFAGFAPDHGKVADLGRTVRSFIQTTSDHSPTEA